ncbi:MAG: hypothetical protein ACTSWY_15390 [Promethearchaeota archaeon]
MDLREFPIIEYDSERKSLIEPSQLIKSLDITEYFQCYNPNQQPIHGFI